MYVTTFDYTAVTFSVTLKILDKRGESKVAPVSPIVTEYCNYIYVNKSSIKYNQKTHSKYACLLSPDIYTNVHR